MSSTVFGNPQIVRPASQVKDWFTGSRVMNVPAWSAGPPAGVTKNVTPTSR